MIYRKFKLDTKIPNYLSQEDRKILNILGGVVEAISKVYQMQKNEGFYPKGVGKEAIEKAAKIDPEILSPFTLVIKKGDKLESVPYHEKYKEQLQPIADRIDQAAKISTNGTFKKYLLARAKSLRNGSYREADIAWLDVKNSLIDFSIGPFERYLDNVLFIKRVFQAHIGVIDTPRTELAEEVKDVLYSSAKLTGQRYHSTDIPKKGVHIYVEHTPATSGYMSDALFSGEHFPSDLDLMQKYGSKMIFYRSQMLLKFEKLYYPIFKKIFEKRFASKYSKELLFAATVRLVWLYELGRLLHKFEGARERLKEAYGPIDEANGFASGLQHSKHLLAKGIFSQDQLEAILVMHITWMFADWLYFQKNQSKTNHVIGNSILLTSYLQSGAIKEQDGIYWPNFSRLFFAVEEKADELVEFLRNGNFTQADSYIKKNADLESFKALGIKLSNLDPII